MLFIDYEILFKDVHIRSDMVCVPDWLATELKLLIDVEARILDPTQIYLVKIAGHILYLIALLFISYQKFCLKAVILDLDLEDMIEPIIRVVDAHLLDHKSVDTDIFSSVGMDNQRGLIKSTLAIKSENLRVQLCPTVQHPSTVRNQLTVFNTQIIKLGRFKSFCKLFAPEQLKNLCFFTETGIWI